jgi:PhnB protein
MSSIKVNPYLMFNGAAEQAIRLYERALGARTETIMRFTDAPGMNPSDENKNRVMHAALHIGESQIFISDGMPSDVVGTDGNVEVCLNFDDVAKMTACFDALAAGGTIRSPLQDTFWGAKFGLLTDAYGVRWMFNCTVEKK